MKRWKRQMTEGIELPNQGKTRRLGEKETYKYLGILEAGPIKLAYMKKKLDKRIPQKNKETAQNQSTSRKSYQRNKYLGRLRQERRCWSAPGFVTATLYYLLKMTIPNRNPNQRRTQKAGLGVLLGRCSLDRQRRGRVQHPTNVAYSFFRYTQTKGTMHLSDMKRKTWTREYNKNVIDCYFKRNPTQRGYRKRMIDT